MALEDYKGDAMRCEMCSSCKFVPIFGRWGDIELSEVCPSIMRYNFYAYGLPGRLKALAAFLHGRIDFEDNSDSLLDLIYRCQMDGACDNACKAAGRNMEPYEALLEWRIRCIEEGQVLPQLMPVIEGLRSDDNMLQKPKADRGKWAKGLKVKDLTKKNAEVCFWVGCRYSYDEELWPTLRKSIEILKEAEVDFGVFGKDENCCGGRAYEMGFQGELIKYMESNLEDWKTAGVKTVVTPCSDCYATFKAWYSRFGNKVEVYHLVEYLDKLIDEGKLKLKNKVPMTVTYHDPCHLGRLSEPYTYVAPGKPYTMPEKKVMGQLAWVYDVPKVWRMGARGIYEEPRNILKKIPGLRFNEMQRIKAYALCCGAGGGVIDTFPDYAHWTADNRLKEAAGTGAEALVTACGWCKRNFLDTLEETGDRMEVYDIIDIVQEAL
ncbi:MAG: (Fe-S)-binding protein [Actinomycetota bacterium]|nr:(Fe-S)-binding protein [Actinomycetota bacterium]